jgi:hypothetical protein
VDFRARADGYALIVCDQGRGFPADYDAECSAGLGMKVLKALVGQLRGELRMACNSPSRGARVTVTWPAGAERYESDPNRCLTEAAACDSVKVTETTQTSQDPIDPTQFMVAPIGDAVARDVLIKYRDSGS